MFTNRKLPMRSVHIMNEYSKRCKTTEYKSYMPVSITPVYDEDFIDLNMDIFFIDIFIIIFNIAICLTLLYLLVVLLSSSICIYNSN